MEEVMLCIVRFLTDTPHPLYGLPEVPQFSKKTESLLRTPSPHTLLLEPTSKSVSDHNQTRKLGTLKVLGLPKHSWHLQCTACPWCPWAEEGWVRQSIPIPDNRPLLSHRLEAFVQQSRWCFTLCINLEVYIQQSQRLLMSNKNMDYFFSWKIHLLSQWWSCWFVLAFVGSASERSVDRGYQTETSCRGVLRGPLWCFGTLRWTCVLY